MSITIGRRYGILNRSQSTISIIASDMSDSHSGKDSLQDPLDLKGVGLLKVITERDKCEKEETSL